MTNETQVLRSPQTLDYSLVGINSTLAVEKVLAEADCYQCVVPRATMRTLLERRDGPAILNTILWFTLIFGSGFATYLLWGFLLDGMCFQNAAQPSRARSRARHSEPLTARTVLKESARRERGRKSVRVLKGTQQALWVTRMATMILFETRGLQLYWVVRGGIRLLGDLVHAVTEYAECFDRYSPPIPARCENPTDYREENLVGSRCFSADVMLACGFKCFVSKRSPFFQMLKVIAAILRANVRRAMAGLIPLASRAA
jgi:hypothetical protein